MFRPIFQLRKGCSSNAVISLVALFLAITLTSCEFTFSTVTNTHKGITMTLGATSKNYSGKIQCDKISEYSDICTNPSNYRVAVYVVTDILYIHPYRDSSTRIGQDGSWSIEKQDRKPLPGTVYAFVLRSSSPLPDQANSMDDIEYLAWVKWAN